MERRAELRRDKKTLRRIADVQERLAHAERELTQTLPLVDQQRKRTRDAIAKLEKEKEEYTPILKKIDEIEATRKELERKTEVINKKKKTGLVSNYSWRKSFLYLEYQKLFSPIIIPRFYIDQVTSRLQIIRFYMDFMLIFVRFV
mgnify:CR=1 FL=1